MSVFQNAVENLLSKADIRVNGNRPWDLRVHDPSAFKRVATEGSMGLGESYMDGLWDCDALDQFFDKLLSLQLDKLQHKTVARKISEFLPRIINMQSKRMSKRVAKLHYNLGNEFYESMLDPWMQYTCGYWSGGAKTLEEAQEAKLDLICRKIGLSKGDKVLELGSGWGGFAKFAAERYGASVVAYNISTEQVAWARKNCEGLPIEFRLQDYREATGEFDKVVSIGMCEHVGYRNYRAFFETAYRNLKPDGIFLVHTIGGIHSVHDIDAWIGRYVFPGAMLPSPAQLGEAMNDLFVLEDLHNFGPDYDRTLMAWYDRFVQSWPRFSAQYGNRFERMWRYYLLCCAGTFRSRKNQLWQLVMSKGVLRGGYKSVR